MTLNNTKNFDQIQQILNDKSIKPKQKTEQLSHQLLENNISADEIINFTKNAKPPQIATCIEALEYATQKNPGIIDKKTFQFITECLSAKEPRIKWESAKVIGNTVHLFPSLTGNAIKNLLVNAEHTGTVVRWSAAFALGEILKLNTKLNKDLIPTIEAIIQREEKASIRKIYLNALKKIR